eukprot:CAMPEP_0116880612 /NCGR_PEP_ID=MMETSP0463-20121206/12545_1 /TAXON_ID=181622 /ORGANISM="Strombidinopsis sp, Strain SopsisLIS2011" /LENGTH=60 /DNA_ID=CAMNT_0004531373 /DNA_START=623 /DNA_END=802 /DNA_ORIENTATION=-
MNQDNSYKSPSEIKEAFESKGVDLNKPMIFTCGGGIMATVLYSATDGLTDQKKQVYDGSW